MDSWKEAQLSKLMCANNQSDFASIVGAAANELGFETYAYGMRSQYPVSAPRLVMISSYPEAWQTMYAERAYHLKDPTVAHGMKSVTPITWSDSLFQSVRELWEEAQSFGLNVGWAQSCHNGLGVGGMLTLGRSSDHLSAAELQKNEGRMTWLGQAAYETMSRILAWPPAGVMPQPLTTRELEILRWTADGKTSAEIAELMKISFGTVNFHVNNAVLKLSAANKTAAVVKALVLGII